MDNPILKRLGALDLNDEFAKKELKKTMSDLDVILCKSKQKTVDIDLRIKECVLMRDNLEKLESKELKVVQAIVNFNAKLHNLSKKKKLIEKAINRVVAKMEICYEEKE